MDERGEGRALDRRDFLRRVAGPAMGLWLVGGPGALLRRPGTRFPRGPAELPPRTVGLRSLGGDFVFDPPGLLVDPGESVAWLNMGDFHTVTAFHPAYQELLPDGVPLRMPEGAEPFHSGFLGLDAGSTFERAFPVEGVYDYFCQPHYSFGMVGRLVVGGPRGGPAVTRPLSELNAASRREMPAVETITGPPGRTFEWASRINGILLLRARGSDAAATADAAARLVEAAGTDAELARLLSRTGAATEVRNRLEGFARAVRGGREYAELVEGADRIKQALRRARQGS